MNRHISPLRYPGGKSKLTPFITNLLLKNDLIGGTYIEPYAGGSGAALSLLFSKSVSNIVLNDKDYFIYCFWYSILNDTEIFLRLVKNKRVSITEYKRQREIYYDKDYKQKYSITEIGFCAFFMNRCNRSGILTGGPIGGYTQTGDWTINSRFNKTDLVSKIEKIAHLKDNIQVYNEDAVDLVDILSDTLPSNSLYYFDPPYFVKGKELYLNYYSAEDHQHIANKIDSIKRQSWIVTYDNVPAIQSLYQKYRQETFTLNYSAGKAVKGTELMIYSDNLIMPNTILKTA